MKMGMVIEHDGVKVTIELPEEVQPEGAAHEGATNAQGGFGKWIKIATCVAGCIGGAALANRTKPEVKELPDDADDDQAGGKQPPPAGGKHQGPTPADAPRGRRGSV